MRNKWSASVYELRIAILQPHTANVHSLTKKCRCACAKGSRYSRCLIALSDLARPDLRITGLHSASCWKGRGKKSWAWPATTYCSWLVQRRSETTRHAPRQWRQQHYPGYAYDEPCCGHSMTSCGDSTKPFCQQLNKYFSSDQDIRQTTINLYAFKYFK